MARVLVVDDDRKTVSTISLYLNKGGHAVVPAYDGGSAIDLFREEEPDVIVLDLMLPGIDGVDIARLVRLESDVPVIMLTARTLEDDKLAGFAAGADDYVTKPFSPRVLAARVEALLRRARATEPDEVVSVGPLIIDRSAHEARVGGALLTLTPTEFDILECLAMRNGRVLSRTALAERVFGSSYHGVDRNLDAHLSHLRRKIRESAYPDLIATVHGVGYKLNPTPAPPAQGRLSGSPRL